jgi:hypothetical protein
MTSLKTFKLATLALATAVATLATAPAAFAADGVRVRGTVVSLAGDQLLVKSRDGDNVTITLAADWKAGGIAKAQLADIKPGDFVGVASMPGAKVDGALEVLVFPPAMRGTGEGSYGWDLKPNSSMTNGSVSEAVQSVDGTTLNVVYHGQSKKINVTSGTPIVTFAPATAADVKPGAAVFVPAQRGDNGKLSAAQVVVGKNGVVPPM